jgi:poly(hydroxyalkanoate) depolymerase family esterase
MRLLLLIALFGKTPESLTEIKSFGSNPGNLSLFVHAPSPFKDSTQYPLVIVLHGCNQNASIISEESGWNTLADRYGFIVAYPQQSMLNNAQRCFNWFLKSDNSIDQGEMLSLHEMIKYCTKNYPIKTSSVFIYGLSAGAFMSVAYMANYPEDIQAGVSCAGGPFGAANSISEVMRLAGKPMDHSQNEWLSILHQKAGMHARYPKLIILQGSKDQVVHPQYAIELMEQWTALHHTDANADSLHTTFENNPHLQKSEYRDSNNAWCVLLYQWEGLGHALPVNPGKGIRQGGKSGWFTVDKDFFSTWYIARDLGLIPNH